jgi:hypothetical protein
MTNGSLRLKRRCIVPGCTHRVGHSFMCKPCWRLVPEKEQAGVWAAVFAAATAVIAAIEAGT